LLSLFAQSHAHFVVIADLLPPPRHFHGHADEYYFLSLTQIDILIDTPYITSLTDRQTKNNTEIATTDADLYTVDTE
jgi:hypothetical protein